MKLLAPILLLLLQISPQTANPGTQHFPYQRTITPGASGPACVVLDPAIFPHAAPSLKDLRLIQAGREIPYALTLSEPQQSDSEPATIHNLGLRGRSIVFDLAMPARPYTELALDLAAKDFIATATISGTRDPSYAHQTEVGQFTIFDLTSQHLARSTTLHLEETNLPFLHVELAVSPASNRKPLSPPELLQIVRSVTVPPSREAQSIYTTALTSTAFSQREHDTVATFALPERVPVERISFDLSPSFKANFSRHVRVTGHPSSTVNAESESLAGTIFRVHLTQAGHEIRQQQLSIPAVIGANMQSKAAVEIAVENGDDAPLPISAVRLEVRQHKLCFDAPSADALTLFYGDSTLAAPRYDYVHFFSAAAAFHTARLGPEQRNSNFREPPDARPFTERHPNVLWIVLAGVIGVLAFVAFRSPKTVHH